MPLTWEFVICDVTGVVPEWIHNGLLIREKTHCRRLEYEFRVEDEVVGSWAARRAGWRA